VSLLPGPLVADTAHTSLALASYLLAAATVFAASLVLTWTTRRVALTRGWVEHPRADRWHSRATARFGGFGILGGLLVGAAAFAPFTFELQALALLTLGMFAVGLLDDLTGLRPQTKLVAQLAAGVLLYISGFRFNSALPWAIDFFVVLFWVVAITNAMNLLDNMDGLAAGIAVIAGCFRFLLYYTDGNDTGAMLSVIFVGAVAGFLVFNFSPASIFMGDCGSFVIGFLLAALNLTTSQMYAKSLVAILLFPALVLAIPIFDTAFVSVVRWFSGRSVSQGGADHTSHRLVAVGLSERQAVLVLYALSIASGGVAYVLYRVGFSYAWFGAAMCVLGLILFGIYLSSISVYPERGLASARVDQAPRFMLPTYFPYKRAMLWVIVDVIALTIAYYCGFLFRYGHTTEWDTQLPLFIRTAPFAVAALLVSVSVFGVYRSDWQTFSLHEVKRIVAGVTLGTAVHALVVFVGFGLELGAILTLALAWGAAVLALTGARGVVRALSDSFRFESRRGERTLIYGAGAGGELALRELRMNQDLGMHVVGFLDDDRLRHHAVVHGVEVLGGAAELGRIAPVHDVAAVVIATGKIPEDRLRSVCREAAELGIAVYRIAIELTPIGEEDVRPQPVPVAQG
jgi:UDP-GlcNAc:undecaprenyl-phosphate/decaprenyl-phosphate GlcNAc-1-phosphate transferase